MSNISDNHEFKNIYQKMVRIQAEMPTLEKTKKVDAGAKKYSHAELDKILSIILPVLRKYNVYYHCVCIDGVKWRVTLTDTDTGEQLISDMPIIGAVDMQKVGSAITYNCRYGLLGLLGLCPGVDDDAQKACDPVVSTTSLIPEDRLLLKGKIISLIQNIEEPLSGTRGVSRIKEAINNNFNNIDDDSLSEMYGWIIKQKKHILGKNREDMLNEINERKKSERMQLTFKLQEIWKLKEGSVRADETVMSKKVINMFKDDFQGAPDKELEEAFTWISGL